MTKKARQPRKSLDVRDRLGVYKRINDVPEHHRFRTFAADYEGRDVWQAFCDEAEYAQGASEAHRKEVDRVGDRWRSFMADRGRHHALATPTDVDEWCTQLREDRGLSVRRAREHWLRVRRFYDWMAWHADYPHRYNPAWMAAVDGETVPTLWAEQADRHRERRARYGYGLGDGAGREHGHDHDHEQGDPGP